MHQAGFRKSSKKKKLHQGSVGTVLWEYLRGKEVVPGPVWLVGVLIVLH